MLHWDIDCGTEYFTAVQKKKRKAVAVVKPV